MTKGSRKKIFSLVGFPLIRGGKGLSTNVKCILFSIFIIIFSRGKMKYILFQSTYPNISISTCIVY